MRRPEPSQRAPWPLPRTKPLDGRVSDRVGDCPNPIAFVTATVAFVAKSCARQLQLSSVNAPLGFCFNRGLFHLPVWDSIEVCWTPYFPVYKSFIIVCFIEKVLRNLYFAALPLWYCIDRPACCDCNVCAMGSCILVANKKCDPRGCVKLQPVPRLLETAHKLFYKMPYKRIWESMIRLIHWEIQYLFLVFPNM